MSATLSENPFDPDCMACDAPESQTGVHCDCGCCQTCCGCGAECDCPACLENLDHFAPVADDIAMPGDALMLHGRRIGAWLVIFALSALPLSQAPAFAKNYGSIGQVFPIAEDDFLEMITAGFQRMEEDGRLESIRSEAVERVKARAARPRGAILPKARADRVFDVDLSITLNRDLADQEGRVFAQAGTVVNPLAYSRFNKRIVFIDGDDPEQVTFALSKGNELDTLLVLARGAPLELMRAHGRRFWFDADQQMITKFGIAALPSVVRRKDPVMEVREVHLEGTNP